MVKHLKVQYPTINEELKTAEIRITFGGFWRNSNEEYKYFWKKFEQKYIENIAKSYFKYSQCESEGKSCGFGFGSITFKFWDIEIINDKLYKLIFGVQEYVDKL